MSIIASPAKWVCSKAANTLTPPPGNDVVLIIYWNKKIIIIIISRLFSLFILVFVSHSFYLLLFFFSSYSLNLLLYWCHDYRTSLFSSDWQWATAADCSTECSDIEWWCWQKYRDNIHIRMSSNALQGFKERFLGFQQLLVTLQICMAEGKGEVCIRTKFLIRPVPIPVCV